MYIIFAAIGMLFLYLETKKTSVLKLALASTFLFCSIIAYKFPQNYLYQLFSIASFSMLFTFLIKISIKKDKEDNKKIKALKNFIGQIATVKKDIGKTLSIDGIGYIEYNNELFPAKAVNDKLITAGKKVKIISLPSMCC